MHGGKISGIQHDFFASGKLPVKQSSVVQMLLRKNTSLFAGGDLSQEEKDAFFEAVMRAYVACKDEARRKFGADK